MLSQALPLPVMVTAKALNGEAVLQEEADTG